MKLKDYKCKCGYNDFFFVDKGNQKGIYCTNCGKWLKWADKDEQNLVMKQEPKIGHWILQPSNKEQGERDFIWWKCSECGQVIYSETEKDRKEFHAFCGRCGAKMVEPQESEEV